MGCWRKWRYTVACLLLACIPLTSKGQADSLGRLSIELKYNPGKVLALDKYVKKWLKEDESHSVAVELHYQPVTPEAAQQLSLTDIERQDAFSPLLFAKDYNYPTFTFGLRYNLNHGTVMHRDADPSWGKLIPVDYNSILGNAITIYGTFSRPVWRSRHWELAYYLGTGIGYFNKVYNKTDQIDNEFLGAHLNIYFTAGLAATWKVNSTWALQGGIDFSHHSNGALYRPNKGVNYLGPFIGAMYSIEDEEVRKVKKVREARDGSKLPEKNGFRPYWFAEASLGVGGKTLLEDWQKTQFYTSPDAPDYRTDKFHFYPSYSFQTDLLYRYARRWASGVGLDLFYGSYSNHVKELDEADGFTDKHSPWSVGIAAKHEVFYGNLSVRVGLGVYLYREMGNNAKEIEKPYYERVGLHYSFPSLGGMSLGFNINAHLTKADFTELQVAVPFRL